MRKLTMNRRTVRLLLVLTDLALAAHPTAAWRRWCRTAVRFTPTSGTIRTEPTIRIGATTRKASPTTVSTGSLRTGTLYSRTTPTGCRLTAMMPASFVASPSRPNWRRWASITSATWHHYRGYVLVPFEGDSTTIIAAFSASDLTLVDWVDVHSFQTRAGWVAVDPVEQVLVYIPRPHRGRHAAAALRA